MIRTKNFNLLVSTSRYNEINAKTELWFTLLICGNKYPIISNLEFSGLITALTNLKKDRFLLKIKKLIKKDPEFFQYILKIVPIDFTCDTNNQVISEIVKQHYREYINKNETFKIDLKRRNYEEINRNNFIDAIAKNVDNKVNLEAPDKVIRIEVLGNFCGISFLKPNEIIRFNQRSFLD